MPGSLEVEEYVKEYGEHYRGLIGNALEFLDIKESSWELKDPINRSVYIRNLVQSSAGGY